MASRVDERGYEQNGNMRQREPHGPQDYDEEQRAGGRTRRPDERDARLRGEDTGERRVNERPGARLPIDSQPARISSALSDAFATAFERSAALVGENIRLYQDETVRFVTERLEHDTALLEQLGKSRSVFDLLSVQQQWFNATTRAYSDEWMRLSRLTSDATQRSAKEARTALNDTRRSTYDAE